MVGVRALLHWTYLIPPLALLALVATWSAHPPNTVLAVVGVLLAAVVLAAVDHAEVVAHRVGEPFGSLILAVAVTVIEVGLIVMLMTHGGSSDTSTLARDTVEAVPKPHAWAALTGGPRALCKVSCKVFGRPQDGHSPTHHVPMRLASLGSPR